VQLSCRAGSSRERLEWRRSIERRGRSRARGGRSVGVFGPVLGPDDSTSILLVQRLMDGAMPGCPELCFGVVDVRDVDDSFAP